jgi:uroporphyrinogen decarboxylase
MTKRERLLAVLRGEIPDCVPACPDISNMVPAKLTGKPFWDIYLFQDPPLWKAYIDAVKYFDIDGGFEMYSFGDLFSDEEKWETRIVSRDNDRIITRDFNEETGEWHKYVVVHSRSNPPSTEILPHKVGQPDIPTSWEKLTGVKEWPTGFELWNMIKKEMGNHGIVGMQSGMKTLILEGPDDIYEYFAHPEKYHLIRDKMIEKVENRMKIIRNLEVKPDFLFCGGSGTLVFQTPDIVRELVLPVLQRTTELAAELGIPTHVHSCGPETELVKMFSEETGLSVIDPLEIPPMGDCDLAVIKKLYGKKIILKGNLHTTNVMLSGTVDDVIRASKKAIDDAGQGGGFILSTGDQCGRDTPDENIRAMVETARTYGRYPLARTF